MFEAQLWRVLFGYLVEAVQVKLSYERLKSIMAKVLGKHVLDKSAFIFDDNFGLLPPNYITIYAVLYSTAKYLDDVIQFSYESGDLLFDHYFNYVLKNFFIAL
jgi:hypothetical protein